VTLNRLRCAVVLVAVFAACANHSASEQKASKPAESTAAKPRPAPTSDCVRGEPEALMASGSEFTKKSVNEAIETIPVEQAIALTVHHFGCAHYALNFDFKWKDGKLPEPKQSLQTAAQVLDTLKVKDDVKPLAKNLAKTLRKMSEEPYKQPVTMSETETLTAITPAIDTLRIQYDVAL
jgi:hypothetical protein